ncbi:alpha-actinin [Tritrichomonas musculus]|uniref:Alpha-actinin n=1 Tax=Tritrichomonas musculus TaxID=1915356 RepID=A0ABR2L3Z9_9EUKA
MNTTHTNTEIIPQQIRAFSNWVSSNLSQARSNVKVDDVTKDFKNGVALVELSLILVGKSDSLSLELCPKEADDIVHNCDVAIDLLTKDGVHLRGISGKEVSENKEKFILGLVWTLILHYSISRSVSFSNDRGSVRDRTKFSSESKVTRYTAELHYRQALMQWAFDRTEDYPDVTEFQPYCLSLCALLDSFYPDRINFYQLDPESAEKNAPAAIKAMNELADTQSAKIDDKALLTQLAVIKITIERRSPLDATISKSRTLILDDEFAAHREEGDNRRFAGRKFGLIMTLKETDYRSGEKINPQTEQVSFGEEVQLALTLTNSENAYLNPSGRMLSMSEPDIKNDSRQQFVFGKDEWSTVIDSTFQRGMVWDVADEFNPTPAEGTPFYVFPFHGRHNQHFVYKKGMIYAQQNGHVVTYVGGSEPLVMMPPSRTLKARQTFRIQLI